ncbi:MAG: AAA family ATPase [Desulfobacterales bacterium]|nr:AAA family ATPase [Desulfobacterales bacterium]
MPPARELTASDLKCVCDATQFGFQSTKDVEPLGDVIGQRRAVQAITFGLEMPGPGYHIFVTGLPGTGKTTIVQDIVKRHAAKLPVPNDWCLVNNFSDEYRPIPIAVPSGRGAVLSKSVARMVDQLSDRIAREFDSESFQKKREELDQRFSSQKKTHFERLDQLAKEKGLQVVRTSTGYQSIPLKDDKPMSPEEFQQLPDEEKKVIGEHIHAMGADIELQMREVQKVNQARQKAIDELMEQMALFVVKDRVDELRDAFRGWKEVLAFFDALQADMVENVKYFVAVNEPGAEKIQGLPPIQVFFRRYYVNVLVDRRASAGAPVIFEPNPTYQNLFGRIEKRAVMGTLETDFTMVQGGSMLQANGGFLIVDVEALLMNPYVWEAIKRALQNNQLQIEDMATWTGFGTASMRLEPIPLAVKVVLIGDHGVFRMLQHNDSRFGKIFKVRADFDHETERSGPAMHQYAAFVSKVCREEKLLHLTPEAVAAVVEYGEKAIAHQRRLSLRFGPTVDLIKEAAFWACKDGATLVGPGHVDQAHEQHRLRHNLYEEKIQAHYVDDTLMVDVDGAVVGQVNALAVYQTGEISFGRPSRITATTYMGKSGVINIEREAKLSGRTHDKGVLILSGYLGATFAQAFPLNLAISIAFEQSYSGVDGDSASSTELYAILSSLADVPICQGIAVTGSVNQMGQIQAIGGVNQKIEGFFDVCRAKGLTGEQGVIIPHANVQNLMVRQDVIDAVAAGRFHVYPVKTIAEGIEMLTGAPAGDPDAKGHYPSASVFGRVSEKLRQYHRKAAAAKKATRE